MAVDLKNLKPNKPTVSLDNYFWLVAGVPKAGKTSLFAKLVQKYYGSLDKGLLLAFEKGYQALKVNAVDIESWEDIEDYIEQLVEKRDEFPYRLIGLDTCDIFWEMAQEEVIREWNRDHPQKRTKDIGGVGAKGKAEHGFGAGYQLAKKKVRQLVDKLIKAGYGVMAISHDKDKEIEQKNGLKYDQLVVSLPNSAREIFVNMADFMVFITIEKEKVDGELTTKRYMNFRSDGYVDAGGRFENVPQRIEYDIDGFINVFENAVKAEVGNIDVKKAREEEKKEKAKKAEENIKAMKNNMSIEELKTEINKKARIKGKGKEGQKAVVKAIKTHHSSANPNNIKDEDVARKVLEELEKL